MGIVAYLDAGSGSMLVGAVAAAGAGVAVAAKVGWRRVTGKLSGKKTAEAESTAEAEPNDEPATAAEPSVAPSASRDDA